jgi:multimeric flavodoxin WrbA
MKIAIFNGTPRKNGNTAELTSLIKEYLEGDDVTEVFLDTLSIKGCRNCGACQKKVLDGHCAVKDDMTSLYDLFLESDAVILASPIYMWGFTAPLKAFIDRLHCMHTGETGPNNLKGKKFGIATTMGDDEFAGAFAVNGIVSFCEYFDAEYCGTIAIPFADKDQINRQLYKDKTMDFVKSLH